MTDVNPSAPDDGLAIKPVNDFASLGLSAEICRAVADQGYKEPTPIQQRAIPLILSGVDLMGGAQTGTGKTAAFTLPLLHRLQPFASSSPSPARHPVRALIVTPTRELALQVYESVVAYSRYLPVKSACVFGGVGIRPQQAELRSGVEVLVSTPGRLLDHIEQKSCQLSQVSFLVLDEADRMLDMGFIPDITRILQLLPQARQSLLFSATFSNEIKRLADSMLRQPTLIEVAVRNTVSENVEHIVHPVAAEQKKSLLLYILSAQEVGQSIVFVRTKQGCSRLARELQRVGVASDAIHGDKSQKERLDALQAFKDGKVNVLVATDVAARGLDIDELPYVINYELPHTPEDYVHRIGRTGRAGRSGTAISLVAADEVRYLVDIEALIKQTLTQTRVAGFAVDPEYGYPPIARTSKSAAHNARERRLPQSQAQQFVDGLSLKTYGANLSPREALSAFTSYGGRRSLERSPSPASQTSLRQPPSQSAVMADGFDPNKPYQPKEGSEIPATRPVHEPRPRRVPLAALLTARSPGLPLETPHD